MSEFDKLLPHMTIGIANNNRELLLKQMKALEKKIHDLQCELSDKSIELTRYEEYLDKAETK